VLEVAEDEWENFVECSFDNDLWELVSWEEDGKGEGWVRGAPSWTLMGQEQTGFIYHK
jgi:hypothetical protein